MSNYNIFKVLKLERKETIHSAMIVAIASHDEKCKDSFFKMLINVVEKKQDYIRDKDGFLDRINKLSDSIIFNNPGHKWFDTEVHLTEKVNGKTRDRGRADIWIGTNDSGKEVKAEERFRLIIENKIDAGFQFRQLRRYYRYLTDESSRQFAGLFVLCVKDDDEFMNKVNNAAETFKTESKKGKETECAIITYLDIITWLEKVIKKLKKAISKQQSNNTKKSLTDFIQRRKPNNLCPKTK